jgi:hypothetical protein
VEMAEARRLQVGEENHSFGGVCMDSDTLVIAAGIPMQFVEQGNVDGKLLVLEVSKNVMRNSDNEIIGTVGIGRDITEDFSILNAICETTKDENTKVLLHKFLTHKQFVK